MTICFNQSALVSIPSLFYVRDDGATAPTAQSSDAVQKRVGDRNDSIQASLNHLLFHPIKLWATDSSDSFYIWFNVVVRVHLDSTTSHCFTLKLTLFYPLKIMSYFFSLYSKISFIPEVVLSFDSFFPLFWSSFIFSKLFIFMVDLESILRTHRSVLHNRDFWFCLCH